MNVDMEKKATGYKKINSKTKNNKSKTESQNLIN